MRRPFEKGSAAVVISPLSPLAESRFSEQSLLSFSILLLDLRLELVGQLIDRFRSGRWVMITVMITLEK